MEFPRVKDQTEKHLSDMEAKIETTREKIERALDILNDHKLTIANKQKDYERYMELQITDPIAAETFYEKKKLGVSHDRKQKKEYEVEDLEQKIDDLAELQKQLHVELKLLVNFTPIQDQFQEVQSEFFRATNKAWEIPNSKFKTFQDIFAAPGYRVLPKQGGIYDGAGYDNIPLDVCVMDPRYVPKWFLEEFELADLSNDLTTFQKIQTRTEAKPKIVDFFDHLQPMSPYGPDENDGSHRLLVLQDYNSGHDGKIIAPTSRIAKDENRKIMQKFDSIYKAQRRVGHVKEGYQEERPTIFTVQNKVKSILGRTKGLKKDDPETDKICEAILAEVKNLEGVINVYKHNAYSTLREVRKLKDSIGRHNPGATCTRLLAVIKDLKKRLPEIFRISESMNVDKDTLNMRIDFAEGAMSHCLNQFEGICKQLEEAKLRQEHGPLFGKDPDKVFESVKKELHSPEDVEILQVRPFNLYSAKIAKRKEAMKTALEAGDQDTLEKEAVKIFVICKIFEIQSRRESILHDVSLAPEETKLESLMEMAKRIQDVTEAREVLPDVQVGYHNVYADLQNRAGELVRGLKHYDKKGLNPDQKREMYERLKKYLEEIDFPAIIEQLD